MFPTPWIWLFFFKNWEERGKRWFYTSKIKTKFTIYWQQCFYLYLQKKTRWYQKDNLQTKNSNIAFSILCLNTTDLSISQFKSSLIQQECVQRPAGVCETRCWSHTKPLTLPLFREVQTANCFRKWEGRRHPTHVTPPTNFYRLKTMRTILDANAFINKGPPAGIWNRVQQAPGGTGAAHATVHLCIQRSG